MEEVPCNLCGSTDLELAYRKPDEKFHRDEMFNVCECRRCGLAFVTPRPTIHEIGKYYPREYFEWYADDGGVPEVREPRRTRFVLERVGRDGPHMRTLLDVGCGNGEFLRAMKAYGWDVQGVETAENAMLPVDEFPIHRQLFSELDVGEQRFHVITAWAVLEHVHDPMSYFRKASELLHPGGRFVFLVNNHASLASRRLFREDVPRHLYFFTEPTVREYLDRNGLELESADFSNAIYELRPSNWLFEAWSRIVRRRPMTWDDVPVSRSQFAAQEGGSNSILAYARRHPLATLDRALVPLVERLHHLKDPTRYGVATYVARRVA